MYRSIIVLCIVLFFFTPYVSADILFYDDCETAIDPNNDPWIKRDVGNSTITLSTDQKRNGNSSYKFVKAIGSTRAEIDLIRINLGSNKQGRFPYDTDFWIGFSIYIPANFTLPDPWGVTGQFHVEKDACDNQTPSTTQAFYQWWTGTNAQPKLYEIICGINAACSTGPCDGYSAHEYESAALNKGAWNDIVWHVKFNHDKAGIDQAWLNGVQWLNLTPNPNTHNDTYGPYIKIGLYTGDDDNAYTLYMDEFRLGDQNSSYNEVAPQGGGIPPDSDAPILSGAYVEVGVNQYDNGATIPQGTTSVNFGFASNENATCRQSDNAAHGWADMSEMATTGGQSHEETAAVSDGNTYYRYMYCRDSSDNESDRFIISWSVESSPPGEENLLNDNTHTGDSGGFFDVDRDADQLWDGQVGEYSYGSAVCFDCDSFYVEFDLGQVYSLDTARIFGDQVGTAKSEYWDFEYRVESGGSWSSAFTNSACNGTQWYDVDVSAVTQARYIRITVDGNVTDHATQAHEMSLTGTVYDPPTEPLPSAGNAMTGTFHFDAGTGQFQINGIIVRP